MELAGAVIVKRSYTIGAGGLTPDPAGEALTLTDRFVLIGGTPWVTAEADTALAKRHGDVIVLGARPVTGRGQVTVGGEIWVRRMADTPGDDDLARNLAGWQPRAAPARRDDARMVSGVPSDPGDRFDRFANAQRRAGGAVVESRQAPLPASGAVEVRHKLTPDQNSADLADPGQIVLRFDYALAPLGATAMVAEPGFPDREARWCPHPLGALTFDTLVVRAASATASAVWRRSWPLAALGPDTLRRVIVTEGDGVMAQPAAIVQGIAFAFPDVCLTPAPPGPPIPIPYSNIAQLADASGTSADGGPGVFGNGKAILLESSEIATSSGDEAGSAGPNKGKCTFTAFSGTVLIHGKKVVRFGDATSQNGGNAVGSVLSSPSTVMVGG